MSKRMNERTRVRAAIALAAAYSYCSNLVMMSRGNISVFPGRLPEMKTTDPYSPRARAKARVVPVMRGGKIWGRVTRRKIFNRDAPRLAAASSWAGSSSSRTGCSVRTTKGRPIKVSARRTPSGVKATLIPKRSAYCPSQPVGTHRAVRAMPATAVGIAKGRSTDASKKRRNGNRYRTRTQATSEPSTELMSAARADAPKVSLTADQIRGDERVWKRPEKPRPADFTKTRESGIRMMSPR